MTSSPASLTKVKSGAKSPSRTASRTAKSTASRAVGVVRVSRVGDRDGERFVSPSEQQERIRTACAKDGLKLVEVIEEMDISGGAALDHRPGLTHAITLIEEHKADVLVVAFFDRLVRSLAVQQQIVERVESGGGSILAVDIGEVRADTASRWLSSSMLGMVSEYHRRVTAERTEEAKRRAIARGVPTFAKIPPGYRRRHDGTLEIVPKQSRAIRDAFKLRAGGATVREVRDLLRRRGIERSYHGTQAILTSRVYLGELRFGKLHNAASHPAIIDPDTFAAVQRIRLPRGRRAKSERLLARLGVLRCATCGSRMVVGSTDQQLKGRRKRFWFYRCPPVGDCPHRVTISADLAEKAVVDATRRLLEGMRGTAMIGGAAEEAESDLEKADAELAAAVEAFTGLDDVPAARARLLNLRDERDRKRERADELRAATAPAITVTADDWGVLTLEEQRGLIRAVVAEVTVAPGKGAGRVTVRAR